MALTRAHRCTHIAQFSVAGLVPYHWGQRATSHTYGRQKHTKPQPPTNTQAASDTGMACLFQTHRCIWYKQISLPEAFIYSKCFLHMDSAHLRQRHSHSLRMCRHMHPKAHSPYTLNCILLPATHQTLECSQVQTQTPVSLYRRTDMLFHSHTQLASAVHTHRHPFALKHSAGACRCSLSINI